MTDNIRQLVALADLQRDSNRADERLLHDVTMVLLTLDVAVFLALWVAEPWALQGALSELGLIGAGGLFSLIAIRYKYTPAASALLIVTSWVVSADVTVTNGGLSSPFLIIFMVPILLSFLLLDPKTRTLVLMCTLLFGAVLWIGETQALLDQHYISAQVIWIADAAILALLVWLFSTAMQQIGEREKRLREQDSRLSRQMAELEMAEAAYVSLITNSIQAVLIYQNGRHVFINRAHEQLTGYSLDDLNQMEDSLMGLIHPEDQALVRERSAARLRGEAVPSRYEIRLVRKDGVVRWVEVVSGVITYQGKPAVQTTCIDITERRQAQEALAASEALFRSLTENAPIGVFMTSGPGTIVYVNDELCRLVGWQASELVGRPITLLLDEQEQQTAAGFWDVRNVSELHSPRRYVVQARRKDGSLFWGEFSINVIRDASGANNIIGLFLDVTEHRESAQKQLELAVEKEKVEMLQQFIGNVSHDLKTPLTIINASLYLLDKTDDPRYRAEKLDDIRVQAEQLGNMIQDLLAMSRLEQGAALEFEPVRLDNLTYDVLRQFQLRLEAKNQTAVVTLETNIPAVCGDANELRRLLSNLFENAINYTPVGGKITCTLAAHAGDVCFSLADTGIGINPADLPHIFDRFYRSASARALLSSGAGLGLAIVKKIVELHGGSIRVESQPNVGTVFHVTLPLVEASLPLAN